MIRINLLEETRTQAKAKGGGLAMPKVQLAENVPVFMLLGGIALAAAVFGVWGMFLISRQAQYDDKIKKAQEEKARLEYVLKRDEELRRKKDDLTRKIGVIADLKRRQDLPVQLLDLVSKNLADFVWLEEMTYTGDLVTIHGKAQTPLAVSNFLRNLEDSKFFLDVAMGAAGVTMDDQTGLTKFELQMTFNPSGQAPKPPATAAAPATPPASS